MTDDSLPVAHPGEYDDPLEASDERKAIGIVQEDGVTVAVADESREEWIATGDMGPVSLEDCR
jgi:hypothetical protein